MISLGEVTPRRARATARRRTPVDDATRNGNRAPLHEVLGELHDGVAHGRGNGLGVGLERKTRGGQETVHVPGQHPGHACLPPRAQQQHRPSAHEDIRSDGEIRRFV
jgi:hypothetical protein